MLGPAATEREPMQSFQNHAMGLVGGLLAAVAGEGTVAQAAPLVTTAPPQSPWAPTVAVTPGAGSSCMVTLSGAVVGAMPCTVAAQSTTQSTPGSRTQSVTTVCIATSGGAGAPYAFTFTAYYTAAGFFGAPQSMEGVVRTSSNAVWGATTGTVSMQQAGETLEAAVSGGDGTGTTSVATPILHGSIQMTLQPASSASRAVNASVTF
jgi:hypothetical protein